jgi:hypothetical protein
LLARSDDDAITGRLHAQDVQRLFAGDPQSPALTDRKMLDASMVADDLPSDIDDFTGPVFQAAVTGQKRGPAGSGQEAQILRVGLRGDG